MKFSEALTDFLDAKKECDDFTPSEWASNKDNNTKENLFKENLETAAKIIDRFYLID